jgi:hypothetical protein
LPAFVDEWKRRLADATNGEQQSLAREVLRTAKQGRYSVVPLFKYAQGQIGRLFVFDGVVRRAVRVELGAQTEGGSNETAHALAFDHYYELEVFTDDSQNNPLVFCVRELPDGFPTGDALREPVRIAGFFFKNWIYRARGRAVPDKSDPPNGNARSEDPLRFAPLLVGRAPLVLSAGDARSLASQYVGVGVFLLGLAAIWVAAMLFSRGDRRFRQQTRAASFSPPPGQSLNNLDLAAAGTSTNPEGQIGSAPSENP